MEDLDQAIGGAESPEPLVEDRGGEDPDTSAAPHHPESISFDTRGSTWDASGVESYLAAGTDEVGAHLAGVFLAAPGFGVVTVSEGEDVDPPHPDGVRSRRHALVNRLVGQVRVIGVQWFAGSLGVRASRPLRVPLGVRTLCRA